MIAIDFAGLLPVLAVLALLGGLGYVLYRRTRPRGGPAGVRLDVPPPSGGPQIGERWWVDVPHQDDPRASKARPCMVIGYSGKGYWVLKCTTQAPREAHWRVPVPADRWNPPADKDGFVDLVPFHLPRARFERSLGRLGSASTYRRITTGLRWERAADFIG